MGALVPFAFGDALVRVIEIGGDPWFVAGDVAKVLGYREAYHMLRMLDDDEQLPHIVGGFEGSRIVDREVIVISESGLYHAIIKSRRPDAGMFRKWVTAEVLPAIRRNGFYQVQRREVTSGWAASLDALRQREPSQTEARMRDEKLGVLAFVEAQIEAGMGKSMAVRAATEKFGRCSATIYSWFKEAKMVPPEDLPVALTPVLVGGGRCADISPEAWAELIERMKLPGARVNQAVREVRALAAQNGWRVPHHKTLVRRIEKHLADPLVGDRTFRDLRQQMLAGPVNDGENA
jgi:prophage antirepressor-like protein